MAIYKLNCEIPTKKSLKKYALGKLNISMIRLSKYNVLPNNVNTVNKIKNKYKNNHDTIICHFDLSWKFKSLFM
ncbi:MAG: hypothetical protein JSW00_18725 [Thermoplasmata archaeon]|nr:MAG: hypothetical protein JSW00_18725 [Thermoplasmata archaeon]